MVKAWPKTLLLREKKPGLVQDRNDRREWGLTGAGSRKKWKEWVGDKKMQDAREMKSREESYPQPPHPHSIANSPVQRPKATYASHRLSIRSRLSLQIILSKKRVNKSGAIRQQVAKKIRQGVRYILERGMGVDADDTLVFNEAEAGVGRWMLSDWHYIIYAQLPCYRHPWPGMMLHLRRALEHIKTSGETFNAEWEAADHLQSEWKEMHEAEREMGIARKESEEWAAELMKREEAAVELCKQGQLGPELNDLLGRFSSELGLQDTAAAPSSINSGGMDSSVLPSDYSTGPSQPRHTLDDKSRASMFSEADPLHAGMKNPTQSTETEPMFSQENGRLLPPHLSLESNLEYWKPPSKQEPRPIESSLEKSRALLLRAAEGLWNKPDREDDTVKKEWQKDDEGSDLLSHRYGRDVTSMPMQLRSGKLRVHIPKFSARLKEHVVRQENKERRPRVPTHDELAQEEGRRNGRPIRRRFEHIVERYPTARTSAEEKRAKSGRSLDDIDLSSLESKT
ncbi:hypothetical protein DACRYDRAFT_100514 [Dacryopinax primogenitus]|uniref:Uncharacterized protein n=1 Tax=Dacryopinax primogenitus (strain DJM 731) TaxID=1858805 RepID=M5G4X5_DACPD|nr:uncharacterized protein DACRYDRAFT_100514 [Dacryopinax primogenitus]EJU00907.1 hypothetical protein DACRYDRAFT_100514 [Dacryopinax primogenitus]